MVTKAMLQKAAEVRRSGVLEIELSEKGLSLDKLLIFVSDMFPSLTHENLRVVAADEGKMRIVATQQISAN